MTWAVSRDAEDETDRVNLQFHGEFKADKDFYTSSDISNNLTCRMSLIYRKTGGVPRLVGYSNTSQTRDSQEWRRMT